MSHDVPGGERGAQSHAAYPGHQIAREVFAVPIHEHGASEYATTTPSRGQVLALGGAALVRTLVNTAISVADGFGPFWAEVGEIPSLLADGAKTSKQLTGHGIDTTPDVHWGWAVASEALEIPTAGVFPSHAVPSLMQLRHDLPRMRRATRVLFGAKPQAGWYDPPRVRHTLQPNPGHQRTR